MSKLSRMNCSAVAAAAIGILLNQSVAQTFEQRARPQQTTASIQEQIVGTWRLVSAYQEDEGGVDVDQFGGAPNGLFMADRQGNFSFQIMSNHGRRLFTNSPPAVVMARFDGLLEAMTYFGTYSVDGTRRKLTLHVAYCLFRGCDRSDRKVDLSIEADTLEMTSAVEPSPTGAFYSDTVWKRECCR